MASGYKPVDPAVASAGGTDQYNERTTAAVVVSQNQPAWRAPRRSLHRLCDDSCRYIQTLVPDGQWLWPQGVLELANISRGPPGPRTPHQKLKRLLLYQMS